VSAAKHPVGTASFAFGFAKGVVARGTAVADTAAHKLRHHDAPQGQTTDQPVEGVEVTQPSSTDPGASAASASGSTSAESTSSETASPDTASPDTASPDTASPDTVTEPAPEPQVVLREPGPPAEPPVDVVGQALAAEQEEHAMQTEPRGATRDEEHGYPTRQRAEEAEIAEEVAEAMPGGDVDVETPVGTTGADAGFNPDTAEADLQQPGTEPLVDPSTTKAVASEQETLSKASRTRKKG
jgi:hypothetical protein